MRSQKNARSLNFSQWVDDELYYICVAKTKSMTSFAADLCLCFRLGKSPFFSHGVAQMAFKLTKHGKNDKRILFWCIEIENGFT